MRALVTGSTGFIGSHLVEELLRKGWNVRCLLRTTSNVRWIRGLPVEIVRADYFDLQTLRPALERVDCVYHVAGVSKARRKEEYFRANHLVTRNLLEATQKFNPSLHRFLHISSLACVGPSLDGSPVDESAPFHPITTYGRSKMEAELECRRFMQNLPITIVRPAAVYGPRETDIYEFFLNLKRGIIPTVGFGDRLVSLVHVRDVVEVVLLAAENERSIGEAYFASGEKPESWSETGRLIAQEMNRKVIRIPVPKLFIYAVAGLAQIGALLSGKPAFINLEKAREIVHPGWMCSIEKAKRELGYSQRVSLRDGIRETVAWYKEEGWL